MAGIDVHQREGEFTGAESFLGQAQQDHRVLAAREQQGRITAFGRHFAQDVDRFRFQGIEVGGALAHPVPPDRRAVELPLVAEGRVEALPSDPHRGHQHLGGTALEPVLAKDADRGVERVVRVELTSSGHGSTIAMAE